VSHNFDLISFTPAIPCSTDFNFKCSCPRLHGSWPQIAGCALAHALNEYRVHLSSHHAQQHDRCSARSINTTSPRIGQGTSTKCMDSALQVSKGLRGLQAAMKDEGGQPAQAAAKSATSMRAPDRPAASSEASVQHAAPPATNHCPHSHNNQRARGPFVQAHANLIPMPEGQTNPSDILPSPPSQFLPTSHPLHHPQAGVIPDLAVGVHALEQLLNSPDEHPVEAPNLKNPHTSDTSTKNRQRPHTALPCKVRPAPSGVSDTLEKLVGLLNEAGNDTTAMDPRVLDSTMDTAGSRSHLEPQPKASNVFSRGLGPVSKHQAAPSASVQSNRFPGAAPLLFIACSLMDG
jgi:hypothetical protein